GPVHLRQRQSLRVADTERPDRRIPPLHGSSRPRRRKSPVQGKPGAAETQAGRNEAVEIGRRHPLLPAREGHDAVASDGPGWGLKMTGWSTCRMGATEPP